MTAGGDPRWEHLQALFHEVLEAAPEEREAILGRVGGEDTELREELRSLVDAHERGGPMDELPASLIGRVADELTRGLTAGQQIGSFRVTREIGHGGMGAVYLAERSGADFEQRVALKLIRRGFDSDELRERFLTERRILATLDHSGIARLVDGGMTERGQPWFAMEFVEGTPVVQYCDARGMPVAERLLLFRRICEIVQYAHRSLVVHRDLKPGNILVTADGDVKLLDFGVAKILEEGLEPAEGTRANRWLTPEYASPEQLRGEPVTTVSDVYALGVLLYELLAGHRPFRLAGVQAHRILTTLEQTEPDPPSSAVSRPATEETTTADEPPTPQSVSRARATNPEQLRRTLSGDLDTIVLKTIRREPARRYGSVDQLSEDVRRYLAGEPVLARPDTYRYRATKFVRRNRVAVAGAALLVLTLAGGLGGTTWQARRARVEALNAQAERDRAEDEANRAERAATLMIDMFRLTDPSESRGGEITASELLAQGAARVERELSDQPEMQAELFGELGRIYHNLGSFQRAQELFERALELRVESNGPEHAEVASSLVDLAVTLGSQGRSDSAAVRLQEAIGMLDRLDTVPAALAGDAHHHLGEVLRTAGRYEEAETSYARALELRRATVEPGDARLAETLFGLAAAHHDRGRFDLSEELFREALEVFRKHPGAPNPLAIRALLNVGSVAVARERYGEAEPLLREALSLSLQVYGPDHPSTFEAETGVGTILYNTGRYVEAEPLLHTTVAKAEGVLGEDHFSVIIVRQVLAMTLSALGDGDGSVALLRRNMASTGPGHPTQVLSHLLLSDALLEKGDYVLARDESHEGTRLARETFGAEHPYVVLGTLQLADVDKAEGRWEAARSGYQASLDMAERVLSAEHRFAVRGRVGLAWAHLERGSLAEADTLFRGALEHKRRTLPSRHPELAEPLLGLARIRLSEGDAAEAEAHLTEALSVRQGAYPQGHPRILEIEAALAAARRGGPSAP